jgi:hypothetical protein
MLPSTVLVTPVVPTVLGYDGRLQLLHEQDALAVLERTTRAGLLGVSRSVATEYCWCPRRSAGSAGFRSPYGAGRGGRWSVAAHRGTQWSCTGANPIPQFRPGDGYQPAGCAPSSASCAGGRLRRRSTILRVAQRCVARSTRSGWQPPSEACSASRAGSGRR